MVITHFCNLSINTSTKHLLSSLCYQIVKRRHSNSTQHSFCICTDSGDPGCIADSGGHKSSCSQTSIVETRPKCTTRVSKSSLNLDTIHCLNPNGSNFDIIEPDSRLSELKARLSSLLTLLPSPRQPLLLMLDGLDQIEDSLQIIDSLPSALPPGVKLILTVSSHQMNILQAIQLHYPQCNPSHCVSDGSKKKPGFICVQLGMPNRKGCVKMLASLLSSSGRKVTSGQQALVNQALTTCCLTLYARLLHVHTSLWQSGMNN